MPRFASDLTPADLEFLGERHLGTLTTLRVDGTPHVVAIAFGYDPAGGIVRIISSEGSQKVRNAEAGSRAAVCQVDGPRWLTLEGPAVVRRDRASVEAAVAAFEGRYRPARHNPRRVAVEILVDRVLGRV